MNPHWPLCKICGERHPLGGCPDLDAIENQVTERHYGHRQEGHPVPVAAMVGPPAQMEARVLEARAPRRESPAAPRLIRPPGPPPDQHSERTTEPWRALGISRRTYYRKKKTTAAVTVP
jgi:hypothetical protein